MNPHQIMGRLIPLIAFVFSLCRLPHFSICQQTSPIGTSLCGIIKMISKIYKENSFQIWNIKDNLIQLYTDNINEGYDKPGKKQISLYMPFVSEPTSFRCLSFFLSFFYLFIYFLLFVSLSYALLFYKIFENEDNKKLAFPFMTIGSDKRGRGASIGVKLEYR